MADFSGGKYAVLSSLALVSNCYIRIYMGANWVVTNSGVIINNFNEGGASEAVQGSSSSTVFGSGDVLTIGIDGGSNDDWNSTSLQTGSYGFFRVFGDFVTNQGFRLFADESGANGQPQNVTLVEVRNSSNTTLIHSFDLSNPTSDTISDSVGSGVLTLVGFSFGPTLTINEASAAFGDGLTWTSSGLGTLTSATISDGTNTINLTSLTDTSATIPSIGNDVSRVITGTGLTVTVGDGVDTAQDTIDLNPPTGYSSVKLTSGFDTSEDSYLFSYGGTPAIGDEFLFVTADVTLDSLGGIEAAGDITTTVYGIDATDGFMESFVLTLGPPVISGVKTTFLSGDNNTIGGNFIIWN